MKTITLLTSGTRGDVLPYIALGEGLRDAGFNVRIAAPRGFASLIQAHRGEVSSPIAFAPFDGNPSDLLIEQGDQTPMTLGTNPIRSLLATRNFLRQARPLYRQMLHTTAEAWRARVPVAAVAFGEEFRFAIGGAHRGAHRHGRVEDDLDFTEFRFDRLSGRCRPHQRDCRRGTH